MLLAALACATVLGMGDVAASLLLPLVATALALAALARFARPAGPFMASLAQMIALACGLYALVTGHAMPGLVLVMLSGLCVIAAALNALAPAAILSGAALLAMGLCFLQAGAGAGVLLFAAASMIGLARPQSLRSSRRAMRGAVVL